MNDMTQRDYDTSPAMPEHRNHMPSTVNAGSVSIEVERAIAEARGQMQLARMFPRDLNRAYAELMEACRYPALANLAFYSVPQGGQRVTGPSIKLIEQVASCCEHFDWGHRELSRVDAGPGPNEFGRSEVEVYAWDKQKNNYSRRQITVLHVLDTKNGPKKLRDQRDIDNKIANVASKQMRGRLQALLPKWLIAAAEEKCRETLAGNGDEPISVRVRKMLDVFSRFGVRATHLERYLGHPLDETLPEEIADLTGVYNALRDGTPASHFFGSEKEGEDSPENQAAALKQTASGSQSKPKAAQPAAEPKAEPKPEPKPTAKAEPEPEPDQSTSVQQEGTPVKEPEAGATDNSQHVTDGDEGDSQNGDVF